VEETRVEVIYDVVTQLLSTLIVIVDGLELEFLTISAVAQDVVVGWASFLKK
jgi:hypothetical protein